LVTVMLSADPPAETVSVSPELSVIPVDVAPDATV
jgi:hypothetical protein